MTLYSHTATQLSLLFEQDGIKDGKSLRTIAQWGGVDELIASLNTSIKAGRQQSQEQRLKRIELYGDNAPITKIPRTLWQMVLENFEDLMLRVLCLAAVVSLILGIATEGLQKGWMEGTSILVAVVIIITVTSGNNYFKEKQFQKLSAVASTKYVNVIRGGVVQHININDVLVGDIQQIETGEIISVDGLLVTSNNVVTDQSAMTGQSIDLKKNVLTLQNMKPKQGQKLPDAFIVSGSKILEGTGKMLILATGKYSQYGKLKMVLQSESDQTPLQIKLTILAQQIGTVGMYCAALTFLCLLGHIIYDAYLEPHFTERLFSAHTINEVVEAFIVAVSIIVVSVPEGLPLAVTIALAYSVGKMKDENNLVRYLQACQTMGGVDNICSDKTGTLTKNIMAVTKIFVGEQVLDTFTLDKFNKQTSWLLGRSIVQNSNATPTITKNPDGSLKNIQIGNKTQCALLEFAFKLGYDYKTARSEDQQLIVFPFSSKMKSMTTVSIERGLNYVFTKGAPDFLLPHCKYFLNSSGQQQFIDDKFKHILHEKLLEFAQGTLRTLLLAYRVADGFTKQNTMEEAANDLVIIGMVGIKDPIRQEIPDAVRKCHTAGVKVRMITGDNKNTAVAIAKEAGILETDWVTKGEDDCTVMLGADFRLFVGGLTNPGSDDESIGNMENFKKVAKQLKVLARSSPTDKYIMATGLKKLNHVVAMTGDGTNDAPALKKADIGFAMGITGTQVAKQAAGIILLDDNFKSIVTAMKWGRNIFDSIRKFLQFQLTVNLVALVMAFTGAAVLKQSPLNPIQMLWVNLIMDTLASLALATEPPTDELLLRKPYSRFEGLITADMWKNIISQGILQIIILGTILFRGPQIFKIPSSFDHNPEVDWDPSKGKHLSIFFHTFVLLQIFNEINARKLKSSEINVFKNFFNNPLFHIILILTIVIQILCIQFGGESLRAVPLSLNQHLICIGLGISAIFAGILFKIFIPTHIFSVLVPKTHENEY